MEYFSEAKTEYTNMTIKNALLNPLILKSKRIKVVMLQSTGYKKL